jgi:lactate dehydrogenase-like 2-hydroxyacid dehydrogenase
MRPSRGMGAIRPELKKRRDNTDFLEGGKRHARRDNTDFAEYAEGGSVNEAGNYTKPGMRKALFNKIKAQATHGTGANEWSARKAQLLAKQYKAKGGSYKD